MYGAWFVAVIVYIYNVAAAIAALAANAANSASTFGISIVMVLIGPLMAFVFWYMPAYKALARDSSVRYFGFFFTFGFHIVMCIFFAIGVPGTGGAGIILGIISFNDNVISAILCLVCGGLWILQALYDVAQFRSMLLHYRSGNHSLQKAKNEAISATLNSETGQTMAKDAVKTAAKSKV